MLKKKKISFAWFTLINSLRLFLTFMFVINIYLQSNVFAQDQSPGDFVSLFSKELNSLNSKPENIKDLIINFCTTIYTNAGFVNWNYNYNPKKSVFLAILCTNGWGDSDFKLSDKKEESDLKKFIFSGFTNDDLCDVSQSPDMNDCKLFKYLPDIFDTILNDYFNIKQASVYGLKTKKFEDKSLDLQVNEFMYQYYSLVDKDLNSLAEVGKPTTLLCSDKSPYPETCKIAKKYIQNANKLVSKIDIINNDVVFKNKEDYTCDFTEKNFLRYNLLTCGLYGEKVDPMGSFTNLLYNEMMYYRLFVWYYLWNISHNANVLPNWPLTLKNNYKEKAQDTFYNRIAQTQKAMSTTLRLLTDMYNTYPLHIGFLMYHEKVLSLRAKLAKLYTPLLTLHDKFQNSQSTK